MSYIGNTNTTQAFTPAIDYFSGNGSTTAFTLSRPVASVAQVQVTIDNVAQNPSSAYTVSANTITFTSAPLSGTNNIYVYYTSPITQVIAPGQGTVQTAQLGNITNIASGNSSLTLQTGSSPTTAVTVDTSQNVGIGATPSAWVSTWSALQVKNGSIAGFSNRMYVNANSYFDGSNNRYIATDVATRYYQVNGIHAWEAAPSGTAGSAITFTESMRIDSSGNVMVGASSSNYRFRVQGAVTNVGEGDTNVLQGLVSTTAQAAGVGPSLLFVATYDGGSGLAGMGSIAGIKENSTSGNYAGALKFMTRPNGSNLAERMRIDSAGSVLINKTSRQADEGLGITGKVSSQCAILVSPISGDYDMINFRNSNGQVGRIGCNGTATSYITSSDYRLKENIAPMTGALAKVAQLKPVTYKWKVNGSDGQGFIAHELAEVVPDCVSGEKDAIDANGDIQPQGIDTSFLVATLTAAIQELKAINDTQAETINALTARIVALENR